MLVLTRRIGESIVFTCGGQTVEVKIGEFYRGNVRVMRGSVRVMIEANPEVKILRKELLDRPRAEDDL